MMTGTAVVVASFADRYQAERAVSALKRAGVRDGGIAVVERREHGRERTTGPAGSKMAEGAGIGAAAGAVISGLAGIAIGAATGGIGLLVYGGLLGAALGANAGGIAGALVGMGIPEYEAKQVERDVNENRVVVLVKRADHGQEIADVLARHGGRHVARRTETVPAVTASREVEERE